MSETSEKEPRKILFRVFAENDGTVFLLYEPLNKHVKVEQPVTKEKLEQAKDKLVDLASAAYDSERDRVEGLDGSSAPAKQEANRQIRIALGLEPRRGFWSYLNRKFTSTFEALMAVLGIVILTSLVYKGIGLSQRNLPEFLHWVVLAIYVIALALCVYLMATEEKRRKEAARIRNWFGPSGMLVLPCLTLIAAAAVFASITLSLHRHGLVQLQECAGRAVAESSLMDFYMWHFMKLVPLVKINEVLKLGEPLCYSQKRVGLLILLFQALVVLPSINTVLYYWKNRSRLTARPYDFVYERGWQPEEKEATH